jgi:hypothetical protein
VSRRHVRSVPSVEHLRCLLALVVWCMASLGCGNLYRFPSAEDATVDDKGHLWLAGSEGFAAVWDGSTLERRDYADMRLADEHLYRAGHTTSYPAARVLEIGGDLQLVTRAGERYRYTGQRWERAPLELGGSGPLRGQVNQALEHDGKLLLYVNDGRLLWVDPATGRAEREEPLYGHIKPIVADGEVLMGIGYRGKARTLVQRIGPTRWRELARFEADDLQVVALARVANHWLVVLRRGLVTVADDGAARFIRLDRWRADIDKGTTGGDLPEGVPLADASLDDIPQSIGVALTAPGIVVLPVREGMIVLSASDRRREPGTTGGPSATSVPPTAPRWFVTGACDGLRERPFPLPVHGPVARMRSGFIIASTASGKLYALEEGSCRPLTRALIEWP